MKYYDEDDEAYFKSLAEKISLDREQIEMSAVDFKILAQDDLRDIRGDASLVDYVATLLETIYMADPVHRQEFNIWWDELQGAENE